MRILGIDYGRRPTGLSISILPASCRFAEASSMEWNYAN